MVRLRTYFRFLDNNSYSACITVMAMIEIYQERIGKYFTVNKIKKFKKYSMTRFDLQKNAESSMMTHIALVIAHRSISYSPQKSILLFVIIVRSGFALRPFCQPFLHLLGYAFSCFFRSVAFCSSSHFCDFKQKSAYSDVLYPFLSELCGFKDFV